MEAEDGVSYLLKKLSDEGDNYASSIIEGTLDIGEYKRLCGVLQGLTIAEGIVKDLADKMELTSNE